MSAPTLRLDDAHRYWLGDIQLPGVTKILGAVIPRTWDATEYEMGRGTALHSAVALLADGKRKAVDAWIEQVKASQRPDDVDKILGKLAAFEKFNKEVPGEPILAEIQMASAKYLYAGTADQLRKTSDRLCLIDWKSSWSAEVELQLGFYWRLLGEALKITPTDAAAVELCNDGRYKMHNFTKRQMQLAEQQCLSVLSVYNWMAKHNRLPAVNSNPTTQQEN
jgi:hypothetical protein